jgi:transposase-like protein
VVTKKCPKCCHVAQVRVERTFKANEQRSSYSCSACGITWTTTHGPDRKPPKMKHAFMA